MGFHVFNFPTKVGFSSKLVLQHFPGIFILLYFTFTHFYPWNLIYYEFLYQINKYGKIHFVSFTSLHLKFVRNNFLAPNSWSIMVMFVIFLSTLFFLLHLLLHASSNSIRRYLQFIMYLHASTPLYIYIYIYNTYNKDSPLGIYLFL